MSDYGIDVFDFELWQGPPPSIPTEKSVASTRPGVDGVSLHLIGAWGEPFEVVVTSHWTSLLVAAEKYRLMTLLVGAGLVPVKYAGLNWALLGVGYHVRAVDLVSMRAASILMGPGYTYSNGASLETRFVLQGEQL